MTHVGISLIALVVAVALFLVLIPFGQPRVEVQEIHPFPRVEIFSPFKHVIEGLKTLAERLLLYKKIISASSNAAFSLSHGFSVVECRDLSSYREILSYVTKELGRKPEEYSATIEIGGSKKIAQTGFTYGGIAFLYRPKIIVSEEGNVLKSGSDVARAVVSSLNGDAPRVNIRESDKELLKMLYEFASKYNIVMVGG